MRHRKLSRRFSRTTSHRKALFKNLASAIIKYEMIKTTLPKAKAIRSFIEPLITLAKSDTVANRRQAFSKLRQDDIVGKLFSELGPRYQDRPGGYLRVLKCGFRSGDNAPMAIIELVDRPELQEESA